MESARRVVLRGNVQGCGLRPALARLATGFGWSGSVRNSPHGVEMIVHGTLPDEERLRSIIQNAVPVSAKFDHIEIERYPESIPQGFHIVDSATSSMVDAQIPPDRAICRVCLEEVHDPQNRRYQYPFTTCTACGPRFSLLKGMPFDRERTAMHVFPPCEDCRSEYENPADRRFHAQTISCANCGPRLWIRTRTGLESKATQPPWDIAAQALRKGKIVAVRGVGGYQLLADAMSTAAIRRLRTSKRRVSKPFAVLCRHLSDARSLALISPVEAEQLESAANPIVLLRQRRPSEIVEEVNPGISDIGLMLPTTALHDLLLAAFNGPLVCTSGNVEGEPLAFQVADSETRLAEIVDMFLHHDCEIEQPVDDSVIRVINDRPVTLRAARGIAPIPLEISPGQAPAQIIVACGGHQKSAVALSNGTTALLGPHVGDLDSLASQDRWEEQVNRLCRLAGDAGLLVEAAFACDHHPRYFPTEWSHCHKQKTHSVWHHHAHLVAGMIDQGWLDSEVLGVAWDGTGQGPDVTIWGGEFLRATVTSFERVAHLRPFRLPGGEACIADVRRTAFSVLSQLDDHSPQENSELLGLGQVEISHLLTILHSAYSPLTTSCGRLFDAAACLILGQSTSDYEGHAALRLESACSNFESEAYGFPIDETSPLQIDWRPAFRSILLDRNVHVPKSVMAMKFHRGLAEAIVAVAQRFPHLPVVLGGGVFQNRALVESIVECWHNEDQPLALPGRLPPNDGGLAAGQLAAALMSLEFREGS